MESTISQRPIWAAICLTLPLLLVGGAARSAETLERIVFVRHGEKPAAGLGQLNCRGLNRALALPRVIARQFGTPTAIIAPNPSVKKEDAGKAYDYVRPLATIEPTAITFGLPVDASIGFDDTAGLQTMLEKPSHRSALVVVAWEHRLIDVVARALLTSHDGKADQVPSWRSEDFDSIYIVTIAWSGDKATASFAHGHQGLDGRPEKCRR